MQYGSIRYALHESRHRRSDEVLDIISPAGSGLAIRDHGAPAFIAAFLQYAQRGNIGHNIVAITGNPCLRAELPLKLERVIHDRFATKRDQKVRFAKPPRLDGVRIGARELFAGFELVQQAVGITFVRGVIGSGAYLFEFSLGRNRTEVERDHLEGSLEVRSDR